MTKEDKELLLKDFCARVPYDVKVLYDNAVFSIEYVSPMYEEVKLDTSDNWTVAVSDIKPYLFPLSSMTDEQEKEYNNLNCYELGCFPHSEEALDYLTKNHFDYRYLIEKGLAIDATGLGIY